VENILSYRIGHPARPVLPLERIRAVGLTRVEISLGPDDDAGEARELLAANGLVAATLSAPCPLADESVFEVFENYAAKGAALGCTSLFTSARAGELPLQVAYDRLRRLGEIAAAHGLKIGLETHPDLCENGAKAAATMAEINHPAVGVNYDTANVYYYNRAVSALRGRCGGLRGSVSGSERGRLPRPVHHRTRGSTDPRRHAGGTRGPRPRVHSPRALARSRRLVFRARLPAG